MPARIKGIQIALSQLVGGEVILAYQGERTDEAKAAVEAEAKKPGVRVSEAYTATTTGFKRIKRREGTAPDASPEDSKPKPKTKRATASSEGEE